MILSFLFHHSIRMHNLPKFVHYEVVGIKLKEKKERCLYITQGKHVAVLVKVPTAVESLLLLKGDFPKAIAQRWYFWGTWTDIIQKEPRLCTKETLRFLRNSTKLRTSKGKILSWHSFSMRYL